MKKIVKSFISLFFLLNVNCLVKAQDLHILFYNEDRNVIHESLNSKGKLPYNKKDVLFGCLEYNTDLYGEISGNAKYYWFKDEAKSWYWPYKVKERHNATYLRAECQILKLDKQNVNNITYKGKSSVYHPNGVLLQEENYNDFGEIIDGDVISYNDDGSIKRTLRYLNGAIVDGTYISYFPSGETNSKTTYKNGKIEGLFESFYKYGNIESKRLYRNGKAHGLHNVFYESGGHKFKLNYINGELDGECLKYHKNGEIEFKYLYQNGEFISSSEYDTNGSPILKKNERSNEIAIRKFLDNKAEAGKILPIEGIYDYSGEGGEYRIAIIKNETSLDGIILEARCVGCQKFTKGDILAEFEESSVDYIYTVKWNKYRQKKNGYGYYIDSWEKIYERFEATLNEQGNILSVNLNNSNGSFIKLYPKITGSQRTSRPNPVINVKDNWKGNGSGIIFSKDGYLATNHHVVENMSYFEVEFKYKQEIKSFSAKLIKDDKINDLAILKIDDEEFDNLRTIPYNFQSRSADIGSEVFALGYPMALSVMGKDIKFTDGRISSKTGYKGDITTYQTTTAIQPGSSGGPLFDHKGNLLGINSSGLSKEIADNVSYTIKTSYLINLIDVLPKSIPIPSINIISSKPLTEQISILSNYVVLIKVK